MLLAGVRRFQHDPLSGATAWSRPRGYVVAHDPPEPAVIRPQGERPEPEPCGGGGAGDPALVTVTVSSNLQPSCRGCLAPAPGALSCSPAKRPFLDSLFTDCLAV